MVSQSTVNVMYRIKPVFEVPTSFKNTSSMYKLKPIKYKYLPSFQSNINSKDEIENNVNLKLDQSSALRLENILSRQGILLQHLNTLKQKISSFREYRENNLTQKDLGEKTEPTEIENDNVKPMLSLQNVSENVTAPTVILCADPDYPPYFILALLRLGIVRMTVSIVTENKSVISLSEHTLKFIQLLKHTPLINQAQINISIIWKKVVDRRCQLLISSRDKSKLIRGETNVLRYLGRTYYTADSGVSFESVCDYVLDLVTRLNCILLIGKGNNKIECSSIIRQLEEKLADKKWFVDYGKGPSIADAAVWSTYIRDKDVFAEFKACKLTKWAESLAVSFSF